MLVHSKYPNINYSTIEYEIILKGKKILSDVFVRFDYHGNYTLTVKEK